MVNVKIVVVGTGIVVLATTLAIVFSLNGSTGRENFYLEGLDENNNHLYLKVAPGLVEYDLISDARNLSNKNVRLLTRFTTRDAENKNPWLIQTLVTERYDALTLALNETIPPVDVTANGWECLTVKEIASEAVIDDKKNSIIVTVDDIPMTVVLDKDGNPVKFGNYTVIAKTFLVDKAAIKAKWDARPAFSIETPFDSLNCTSYSDTTNAGGRMLRAEVHEEERMLAGGAAVANGGNADYQCYQDLATRSYTQKNDNKGANSVALADAAYIPGGNNNNGLAAWPVSCSAAFRTANPKTIAFQGTDPSSFWDVYYDITAIFDNFEGGYEAAVKGTNAAYKVSVKATKWDLCVGHSLGGAIAKFAGLKSLCGRVVTFGAPYTSKFEASSITTPITQYVKKQNSDGCCSYTWYGSCSTRGEFMVDPVTLMGTFFGDHQNKVFRGTKLSNNNCQAGLTSTMYYTGASLHSVETYNS